MSSIFLPVFLEFSAQYHEADQMNAEGERPRDRIGNVDHARIVESRDPEHRPEPDQTQETCADQRYDGRHDRIAHAADRADADIHHTTEHVGRHDHPQANHARVDDLGISRIDTKERPSEEKRQVSQNRTNNDDARFRLPKDGTYPLHFAGTQVLTSK